jgi:lactate/malate dehydrogenase, NAD binding domain
LAESYLIYRKNKNFSPSETETPTLIVHLYRKSKKITPTEAETLNQDCEARIRLVFLDRDSRRAEGHLNDLGDAEVFFHTTRIFSGDFSDCCSADVTIITAGVSQSGQKSRMEGLSEHPAAHVAKPIANPNALFASRSGINATTGQVLNPGNFGRIISASDTQVKIGLKFKRTIDPWKRRTRNTGSDMHLLRTDSREDGPD